MSVIDPSIFKDYDIRGIYPKQINKDVAYRLGQGLVEFFKTSKVAVGRDMRLSSPQLFKALTSGVTSRGADVVDLGLISTDMHWFASGKFNFPLNVMISASHNPPEYNGFKFATAGAQAVSGESGIFALRDLLVDQSWQPKPSTKPGRKETQDIMRDWINHALSFVDLGKLKPLRVVVDAGNGMAGKIIPKVQDRLPLKITPLFFELDGSFPNHLANPLEEENLATLKETIKREKADLGMAFDGDADRVVVVDEKGRTLSGTILTAMIAKNLLQKSAGATILYNAIVGRVVPETIEKYGGKPLRYRVGHSPIKQKMREANVLFGGEHSYHFFFRDNYYADSGLIAALILLELISLDGRPLSEIVREFDKYPGSGEINFKASNAKRIIEGIKKDFPDAKKDELDGITVRYKDWWFNVRASHTEPLVRLNIEADTKDLLAEKTEEVTRFIENLGGKRVE